VRDDTVVTCALSSLRDTLETLQSGECAGCALPIAGPPLRRLWAFVTLPLRRWQAERVFASSGAEVIGRWGVDPDLDSPSCVFELGSFADKYAGEHLRRRGSKVALRRALARVFGCDPALGAVVIVGRKH
jgi:hypothetical protein